MFKYAFTLILALSLPVVALAQSPSLPLTRAEILGRLASGSSPSAVAHLVKTRGLNFIADDYYLSLISRSGGNGILVERLSQANPAFSPSSPSPDPPFAELAKCSELVQIGPIEDAEKACEQATLENPQSPWPLLAVLRCVPEPYMQREDAVSLAHRAVALAPQVAATHLALGLVVQGAELKQTEFQKAALLELDDLNVLETLHFSPFTGRASTIGRTDPISDPDRLEILQVESDFAAIHCWAANYYAFHGTKEQVFAEMQEAFRLEPDNAALHASFASILDWTFDEDEKVHQLREAARLTPHNLSRLQAPAFESWASDRLDEAVAEFHAVLEVFPQNFISTFRLVEIFSRQGKPDAAIAELRRFLDATSKSEPKESARAERIMCRKQLGDLLVAKGDFQNAASEFETVLREDASDARTHNALGVVYARQNFEQKAVNEFQLAVQNDPEFAEPENDLAWIYATSSEPKCKNPTAALQHARRAVEILELQKRESPQFTAAVLDTLAEALLINGRPDEALETEQKALATDPDNSELKARLARFQKALLPSQPN